MRRKPDERQLRQSETWWLRVVMFFGGAFFGFVVPLAITLTLGGRGWIEAAPSFLIPSVLVVDIVVMVYLALIVVCLVFARRWILAPIGALLGYLFGYWAIMFPLLGINYLLPPW